MTAGPRPAATPMAGILLMIAAVFCFAVLDTIVKHLGRHYPIPGLVWARYATHLLFMLVLLAPRRGLRGLLRTQRLGIQIVRSLLLLGSSMFFFLALKYLPLAEASAIGFVTPLLVTAFSALLLGERVGPRRWTAVAVGFVGVLLIVRPGGLPLTFAVALPLCMSLCYSLYQIVTRRISGGEDPYVSLFYTAVVGTVVMAAALPFGWETPALHHVPLILATGFLGGLGHLLMIQALGRAPASALAPFTYSQLIWVTLLGFVVFGDFPDAVSVLGMCVIAGSGLYIAYREAQLRKADRQVAQA